MPLRLVLSLLLALTAAGSAVAARNDMIAKAVADPSRPAEDRALDTNRKPAEVLAFSGVRPGQVIGEYLPGGGYYTRLLSDIVGPKGKVYALETTTWGKENVANTQKALDELPVKNTTLDLSPLGSFRLPQKVDVFWTTLNYHDLHVPKYAAVDMAAFNKQVYDSLRPGGTYFIIDHAAASGTGASASPTLHRIEEKTVIDEVTAAGFKLAGESQILRNPADDHSRKVFDPAIRMKTDQFVLKFRKP